MRADHGLVAEILRRLDDLLDSAQPDAETAHRELDSLTAILESHFRWEERRLTKALNALADSGGTSGELLGIGVPSEP
ncbi:hemerythrin domain-containing protein [Nocardia sp. 2YAB30]|uniref:hemerythrin domain-containing protein n=1 Tax=unclassified Nocardia TaxID=2637762 RepID=UPI003F98546D